MSNRRSVKPASARRAAIGRPIMPSPMKAMVAGGESVVMKRFLELKSCAVASSVFGGGQGGVSSNADA